MYGGIFTEIFFGWCMQSRIEYISLAGLRVDGRRPEEARRIQCQMGLLPNVDGSGYMEQGNTKVVAAVLGPREVREQRRKRTKKLQC